MKITIKRKLKNQRQMLKDPLEKPSIPKKFLLVKSISNKLPGHQKKMNQNKKEQHQKIVINHHNKQLHKKRMLMEMEENGP